MAEESTGQIIERIALECGVDPNDPVFRAKLTKAMLERGIFPAPKSTERDALDNWERSTGLRSGY